MIKTISALELPSMSVFNNLYEALNTPQYNVFGYLSNSKGDIYNITGLITRLQLLKILCGYGNDPFYGADLFGASESLGGWMNGLSVWGIITETGNHREVMIEVGNNLFTKCFIKEWKLNIPVDELRAWVDEFRSVLVANI